jgi:hypothetical protein
VLLGLGIYGVAFAATPSDRIPVAVLWMGDAASLDEGQRVADELTASLNRSPGARPLDSAEDRRVLVEGGAVTKVQAIITRAEAAFVKLKMAEAVKEYEAAEQLLLTDVPILITQQRLGAVERNLLVAYDQLGRAADAARAAERLTWTAGTNEDVKTLLDRHLSSRAYQPAWGPVKVNALPAGALLYRNLQPVGAAPGEVAGGDPAVDVLDVEAPGYRRGHSELGHGTELAVTLQKEDRLGALVDELRAHAPDAPAAGVAELGKRVGAKRVLAVAPDGNKLIGRWLDVAGAKWTGASVRVDQAGQPAMDRLAGYVSPAAAAGADLNKPVVAAVEKKPVPVKSKWGAWGKWYTWVAAGGVLLLVGGLLIAQNVGSDSLKISVSH